MFIQIGDRLKNITDFSDITKGEDGTAVLLKKGGGVTQMLSTSIDFDDLVKQMTEGHMLITPERKRPQMAKAHPAPVKKPEGKKPEAPKAVVKPTETKPAKPAETPKADTGKTPEAPKPKVVEAKKPEPAAPKETPAASVNENEPDYIGKVHDRGDDENGNGSK